MSRYRAKYPGPSDTGWITFPFAANYANYGAGYQVCQYRKFGTQVILRGLITRTGGGTAAAGTPIGTLPAGFRPPDTYIFGVEKSGVFVRLDVGNTGVLALPLVGFVVAEYLTFAGVSLHVD